MEKKIEDYAHLYIGCKVLTHWGNATEIVTLEGVANGILIYEFWRDETKGTAKGRECHLDATNRR